MRARAFATLIAYVIGVVFSIGPLERASATDAPAVKKAIEALKAVLKDFDGKKDDIKDDVSELKINLLEKLLGKDTDLDRMVADAKSLAARIDGMTLADQQNPRFYDALDEIRVKASQKVDIHWVVQSSAAIKRSVEGFIAEPWEPKKDNADVLNAMYATFARLKLALGRRPVDAFKEYSSALNSLLAKDTDTRRAVLASSAAVDSAYSVYTTLSDFNHDKKASDQFKFLIDEFSRLLTDKVSRQAIALYVSQEENKKENEAIKKRRTDFEGAYETITDVYKIHVVSSWAGDVAPRPNPSRVCSSTASIQALCQQQAKCSPKIAAAAQELELKALCGFDPLPLADSRQKAVFIEYACVRGLKDAWDYVAQHPGLNPETKKPWSSAEVRVARLQSPNMEIRCPFPIPPIEAAAAK